MFVPVGSIILIISYGGTHWQAEFAIHVDEDERPLQVYRFESSALYSTLWVQVFGARDGGTLSVDLYKS